MHFLTKRGANPKVVVPTLENTKHPAQMPLSRVRRRVGGQEFVGPIIAASAAAEEHAAQHAAKGVATTTKTRIKKAEDSIKIEWVKKDCER